LIPRRKRIGAEPITPMMGAGTASFLGGFPSETRSKPAFIDRKICHSEDLLDE
jgi:hypothetical protein